MKLKLEVKGNRAIFKNATKEIKKDLENEILRTTEAVADQARAAVPVDTGFLRNSITDEVDGLEGLIRVKQNYAPYVEFGTGAKVDVPEGLEEYAAKFKGDGEKQVNIPAQPYLYPAFKTETTKMIDRLRKKLEQ